MISNEKSSQDQEEENNEEEAYEKDNLSYDPEKINIFTKEPTIEQLVRRIDEKTIDLAPDFQRQSDIWKDKVKSRLIESVIIRIPLPAFYVDGTNEEQWLIVDGLQRLSTLKQFIGNKLQLTGLEYLKELNGKTYQELPRKYQRGIEETQVTVYLVAPGTPAEVKYNIFERINTGGERLTPQEIRHALNPGKVLKLLLDLSKSPEFTNVIPLGEPRIKRMDDREFVLGALAVMLPSDYYKNYAKDGREKFLDNAMKKINHLSDSGIERLENQFKNTMIVCQEIFGNEAFSKPKKQRKNPVNKALFETWSFHISQLNSQQIQKLKNRKQELLDKFAKYVDDDKEFLKSISQAQDRIKYRFETIEEIIKEVLND